MTAIDRSDSGTTRRSVLGRLGLAAAGALGFGAGGLAASRHGTSAVAAAVTPLRLHAPALRVEPRHLDARTPPTAADSPFGELVDDAGRTVGAFRAAALPGGGALHVFTLPEGQLFGLGAGGLEGSSQAVVGGTERFAGAAGSYTVAVAPGLPGRSVTFTFSLTPSLPEA